MTILENINQNLVKAMKAKDQPLVECLRGAKSAIEIAQKTGKKIDEISILRTEIKKRLESAELFEQASRHDIAEKEKYQAFVIETYLPKMMSKLAVENYLQEKFKDGIKTSIGQATGIIMKELHGQVDGSIVRQCIEKMVRG